MTVSTTYVPQPTFGPLGFILPAESAILAGVLADMQAAFGGNLNLQLTTPQGQLAISYTAEIGDCNNYFLFLTNQFDPALNSGRYQDGIANIYFLKRLPALPTSVPSCLCTGLPGVAIPIGSLASDNSGNIYSATNSVIIGAGGNVTMTFACTATGPIACPAGSLSNIVQAIPGWDSITNTADGVIGVNVESSQAFELRRAASVAVNSVGPASAIQGNVLQVPGVLDAYTYDNSTNGNVTLLGQVIAPNSIYVCVAGGNSLAVATAIWQKKAPGCSYTGNTTVTVTDSNSGYEEPFPTYSVSYQTPSSLPIIFAVTLKNNASVPSNVIALVQAAIVAAFSGASPPTPRARIGSTIFASAYYGVVAGLGSFAQIISILIGSPNSPAASFTASIANMTMDVTAVSVGNLAVGQTVTGPSVAPGSVIIAAIGNATTTGNYTLSTTQTVTSEAMQAVSPTLNDLTVNVNQVPTIAPAQITVTLV